MSRSPSFCLAILYTDVVITLASARRCASHWAKDALSLTLVKGSSNGWGAVCLSGTGTDVAFASKVPPCVLAAAAASRAYIYWLEATAQLLALVMVADFSFDAAVCFVDCRQYGRGACFDEKTLKTLVSVG